MLLSTHALRASLELTWLRPPTTLSGHQPTPGLTALQRCPSTSYLLLGVFTKCPTKGGAKGELAHISNLVRWFMIKNSKSMKLFETPTIDPANRDRQAETHE